MNMYKESQVRVGVSMVWRKGVKEIDEGDI